MRAQNQLSLGQGFPDQLNKRHRVIVNIFDVLPDELPKAIKYYNIKTNTLYEIDDPYVKKDQCYKIWQITLGVRDQSLKGDKYMEFQIFTFDNNPINIFSLFDL